MFYPGGEGCVLSWGGGVCSILGERGVFYPGGEGCVQKISVMSLHNFF